VEGLGVVKSGVGYVGYVSRVPCRHVLVLFGPWHLQTYKSEDWGVGHDGTGMGCFSVLSCRIYVCVFCRCRDFGDMGFQA